MFWLCSGNPRDKFYFFLPCPEWLSKGARGQIQLDPVIWDGGRERGTGARRTLCPGTRLSIRSLSSEVSGGKEQGEAYGRASDELSMHPSLRWSSEKAEVIQEGLSRLSPPFSMGKWRLPIRSGAGVQQWALSSPAASGKITVSLAKTLSPFLGHSSIISSSPLLSLLRGYGVRTWDEQRDRSWGGFRGCWSLRSMWQQIRRVRLLSVVI